MGLIRVLLTLSSVVALWTAPAFGTDPVFGGADTANIATIVNSAMIPDYTVTDADSDTLSYSVTETNDFDVDSATGLVTTKNLLTAAATGTYHLIVSGGSVTPVTGTIDYTVFADSNDPAIGGTLDPSVAEDAAVGDVVVAAGSAADEVDGIIGVTDADSNDGSTYEISGADSSSFTIDLWSGVVKTAATLDYETKTSYSLTLTVKDSKRTAVTDTLTITVTDVDEPPACSDETKNKTMYNGAAADTEVYTMSCSDPEDATVTYNLSATGNTGSDFKTDGAIIKVANVLNYTRTPSYVLLAEAVDETTHTSTVTINVDVSQSNGGAKTTTVQIYIVAGLLLIFKCL